MLLIGPDGTGQYTAFPALADIHTHLRVPGQEHKENLESAVSAACHGGFYAMVNMANTNPPVTDARLFADLNNKFYNQPVKIIQIAGLTVNQAGKEPVKFENFIKAGAFLFSDDGKTVMDRSIMKEALAESRQKNFTIITHNDNYDLHNHAVLHKNAAQRFGLEENPSRSEYSLVERDLDLLCTSGGTLHIAHVSARETVELIRQGKKSGLNVTADVTPHHLSFCEDDISSVSDVNMIMAPPLRSRNDKQALLEGLADGTIDAVATDHAPHTAAEKGCELNKSVCGTTGLETAFAASWQALSKIMAGHDVFRVIYRSLAAFPRKFLRIPADSENFFIFKKEPLHIENDFFLSSGKNSSWLGKTLPLKIIYSRIGNLEYFF